jgi:hypothetical protein
MSIIILFLLGLAGAITKDIIQDNTIKLPKKADGNLMLGSIGGAIIGGFAGILIDGNPTMAFMSGYAGTSIISNLVLSSKTETNNEEKSVEETIRLVAIREKADQDLAMRVAKCESNLNPKALNINKDGSRDRGIFQINDKYHPEITDEMAYNPAIATTFFCNAVKAGNLTWWSATQKCWDK